MRNAGSNYKRKFLTIVERQAVTAYGLVILLGAAVVINLTGKLGIKQEVFNHLVPGKVKV